MKQLLPLLLLSILYSCNPEPAIEKEALTKELESIYQDDQKYRAEMNSAQEEFGWNSPEMQALYIKYFPSCVSRANRLAHLNPL